MLSLSDSCGSTAWWMLAVGEGLEEWKDGRVFLATPSRDGGVLDNGVTAPTAWAGSESWWPAEAGRDVAGAASWAEAEMPLEDLSSREEQRPSARKSGGMRLTFELPARTRARSRNWMGKLSRGTTAAAFNAVR